MIKLMCLGSILLLAQTGFSLESVVEDFLSRTKDNTIVVIQGGEDQNFQEGMTFDVSRMSEKNIPIETGKVKVIKIFSTYSLAQVTQDGSDLSAAIFKRFPQIMTGDKLSTPEISLAQGALLMPTVDMKYHELFVDAKALPSSFELSESGKEMLKNAIEPFKNARIAKLAIQGYTDASGSLQETQAESYQRALTIRQYLVSELGFESSRLIPLGLGYYEPLSDKLTPETSEQNRRIVINALDR